MIPDVHCLLIVEWWTVTRFTKIILNVRQMVDKDTGLKNVSLSVATMLLGLQQ